MLGERGGGDIKLSGVLAFWMLCIVPVFTCHLCYNLLQFFVCLFVFFSFLGLWGWGMKNGSSVRYWPQGIGHLDGSYIAAHLNI